MRRVCKVLKFMHAYVFSMRKVLFLSEIFASGEKCLREVDKCDSVGCPLHPHHQPAMRKWTMPDPWFSKAKE